MAIFYEEVVVVAGLPKFWLPPHTARVEGALRLALSGASVRAIQVFCRWGSQTVLRYVREAVLGLRAGHLRKGRQDDVGLTLRDLRKAVHGKSAHSHVSAHLTEQALEAMAGDPSRINTPAAAPMKDVVEDLGLRISTLHSEISCAA